MISLHTVKCFQVLLCNSTNKTSPIFYTKLNDQTVLFLKIQFVYTQFKCQTFLFYAYIGPYQVLPLQVRVDLRTMVIKEYSAFPNAPASLEPHH